MKKISPVLAALLLAACQMGGQSGTDSSGAGPAKSASGATSSASPTDATPIRQARADLQAKSGSKVAGTVDFTERDGQVRIEVKASGLTPNSEHAIHIHEKGDCSAPDATSAGGHFNPDNQPHGNPHEAKRHAGDLPNLRVSSSGNATAIYDVKGLTLDNDFRGILQRAVVIHAKADDYKSQPAGDAGGRIACGVIRKM